jgi:signal transduction histidine kinase/ActR/RegA family two-component response regulator
MTSTGYNPAQMSAREGETDSLQQRLLAVVAASGSLLRSPQVDDVTPALLRIARDLVAADGYAVWRVGQKRGWQTRAFDGVSEAFTKQVVRALNESATSIVPFAGPLVFEDVFASLMLQDRAAAYAEEGIRSMLSIPLDGGDAASATLVLYYRTPHRFTDVEIETARALGSIASAALTTAELYDEQRRTREHATFLAQAGAALSDSLEFETTLNTVARLAVPGIADSCAIHLIDEEGTIRLVAAVHVDPVKAWAMEALADPRTSGTSRVWLRAIREGTAELLADITPETVRTALEADDRLMRVYEEVRFASQISVPLRARGRTIGGLTFMLGPGTRRYDESDLRLAEDLAHRAAIAVENARLYRAAQENEAAAALGHSRARFLADVGAALASSLDYETTLKTVANLAVPGIADWCAVDILNELGTIQRLAMAHVDPEKLNLAAELDARYPKDPGARGGVQEVIRTGRPVMMADIPETLIAAAARDAEHLRLLRGVGVTSYICVPLLTRGRTLGALTFVSAESGRRYTDSDLRFAQDVASRAALAVENARVYRQAHDASRLKDEFLGTLSHELRTPLNAILGYARMLRSGVLSDSAKQARALEILERNALVLTQIVEDVLDVSRIISGKLRLNVHELEWPAVIDDAVATVLPAAEAKGVSVELDVDRSTPAGSGDPERLQQVVWNLLNNAVKFTPHGGVVRVRLRAEGAYTEVTVSDTGRGIAADFLPHLFERFRQADSHFSREHGGLGLGLAIARDIVETHGGTIQAASGGEGRGATFTVRLPIATAMVQTPPVLVETGRARAERAVLLRGTLAGLRVLVVDDDDDARALVQVIVEEAGGHAVTAGSGAEALLRLDEERPDVMVADLGMPGMDGLQLIEAVRRRSDAAKAIPAVALTTYAHSEDRLTALSAGYQRHLPKPIDHSRLVATILALVRERIPNS